MIYSLTFTITSTKSRLIFELDPMILGTEIWHQFDIGPWLGNKAKAWQPCGLKARIYVPQASCHVWNAEYMKHETVLTVYGCFRKWWYPQIIHFNRVLHYKPSILGYPYFRKHPYTVVIWLWRSSSHTEGDVLESIPYPLRTIQCKCWYRILYWYSSCRFFWKCR